jgi:hypothetical protein
MSPAPAPRLPILMELEQQLRAQLDAAYGLSPAPPPAAKRSLAPRQRRVTPLEGRRPLSSQARMPHEHVNLQGSALAEGAPGRSKRGTGAPRRVLRRVAALAGILCVIGGAAIAGRSHNGRPAPATSSPTVIGAGAAAGTSWQLSAYRHQGALCQLFLTDGVQSSACGSRLGVAGVRATSTLDGNTRFVVGLAGAQVRRVSVRVGSHSDTVAARQVPRAAGSRARLPAGLRWFVVALDRDQQTATQPAFAQPLDSTGRRLHRAYLDCTIGQGTVPCLTLAEREAR